MNITATHVGSFLRSELKSAQAAFAAHPSSANWNRTTVAMFHYQQWFQALRSPSVSMDALIDALNNEPLRDWGNTVCRFIGADVSLAHTA